ncbi:MAG: hypothetical protein LIO58_08755 [Oscillospiraceae bacterium]|nr:hypothetical protein [Oscillospiraceae bacterium]
MDNKNRPFQWEVSGSLTPALDGAPHSKLHTNRTNQKKGRMHHEAPAGKEKNKVPLLDEHQER